MANFPKRAALILTFAFILTTTFSCRYDRSGLPIGDISADVTAVTDPDGITASDTPAAIEVVVTFNALFELALTVGGGRVGAANIMPPGAEAHHFEPGARDLSLLSTADVFLVCGLGFDPWAESAVNAAGNVGMIVCDVSRGIEPIALFEESGNGQREMDAGQPGDGGREDHEGRFDPHIWLSPTCAKIIAENIRDAFIESDPDGAECYARNFNELAKNLDGLYKEYSEKFEVLENKTIVTGHAVFAYLCRDFGLSQNSVEGVFAEGEPSARALAGLIDFCRANGITTILTESTESSLVAETLASEAGAAVMTIYTMENAEDGLSFIERMERNLEIIYKSLQ